MQIGSPAAIVTGAGSGIGRAIAQKLSSLGWQVTLVGRRLQALEETAASLETRGHCYAFDLSKHLMIPEAVEEMVGRMGRLDALVNNAAIVRPALLAQATPEDIVAQFECNAIAPTILVTSAWKHLTTAGLTRGRATVVNISSKATLDPFPNLFAYGASKGAMNAMARSIHNAGKDSNIRSFALAPGAVETSMLRQVVSKEALPSERALRPEYLANVVADCLLGKRDAQSGEVIPVPSP